MCWFFSEAQNTRAPSDTHQKAQALYSLCANRHRRATTPLYATVLLPVQRFFSLRGQLFFFTSVDIGKQNSGLMLWYQCALGRHLTRITWCGILLRHRCVLSLRKTGTLEAKLAFLSFLLVSLGSPAVSRTQRSACEEACVGLFAPNTHSSHLLGIFTQTQTQRTKKTWREQLINFWT